MDAAQALSMWGGGHRAHRSSCRAPRENYLGFPRARPRMQATAARLCVKLRPSVEVTGEGGGVDSDKDGGLPVPDRWSAVQRLELKQPSWNVRRVKY